VSWEEVAGRSVPRWGVAAGCRFTWSQRKYQMPIEPHPLSPMDLAVLPKLVELTPGNTLVVVNGNLVGCVDRIVLTCGEGDEHFTGIVHRGPDTLSGTIRLFRSDPAVQAHRSPLAENPGNWFELATVKAAPFGVDHSEADH